MTFGYWIAFHAGCLIGQMAVMLIAVDLARDYGLRIWWAVLAGVVALLIVHLQHLFGRLDE